MTSSKPLLCGPCHIDKVNAKADIWCYNCDEGLCSNCLKHHKQSTGVHGHKTINIKIYKPSIPNIKTECDEHNQELNLYCPSHLIPCCDECISTYHLKCTGIKSLASVVEKTKIEKSKVSVETDMNSILYILGKLINNKSKNIKTVEDQCVSIKKSTKVIRTEINKHLDHLEQKLCQDTDTIWNQEKSKATDFISKIERKKKHLKEMKEHLQTVTTDTSKLQSFLGVHKIEQQVHQVQQYVEELVNNERAKDIDIKMNQNDELEKMQSKLESLESLGEVMVVKTEIDFNRKTSFRREAQVESQSSINNIAMNIETKIKINIEKRINDMICLMDGRIVVVELWGKVNLLTSDGKLKKKLPISGGAWNVTQINRSTIAISYPLEVIKIFNMENEKVTKHIMVNPICQGLSFSNKFLAVSMYREIGIFDLEGKKWKSIHNPYERQPDHFVYCNDRVIYSNYYCGANAVCSLDESNKQTWQYKQNLVEPAGICVDVNGNIIVADKGSNRIIVISKNGENSKVLISEEDGLNEPMCICFKHNEFAGFICDYEGTYLATFNISTCL